MTEPQYIAVVPQELFIHPNHKRKNTIIKGYKGVHLFSQIQQNTDIKPRHEVETNPDYRQPIPYILVQNYETEQFVLMRRERKQTESRLHDKLYIGIGGHVEDDESIEEAAKRELHEEFLVDRTAVELHFQGIILTYDSAVNIVHVGILYHYLTGQHIFSQELDLHRPRWATVERLVTCRNLMESWSKVVMEQYIEEKTEGV